ncbi:MAG TPA: ATP-dependent RecD-like DNA helicase [Anaerolineaceae bacterium]|nr:ATP-dependent RecD-like DNA helicase [Anaerolineaceae bacterium]HPN50072.1 ATP-dependent RecD-like DNA helicase [Anaerolineaceae bacterium]
MTEIKLVGRVGKIIYRNPANDFAVIVLDLSEPTSNPETGILQNSVKVQGIFPTLAEGLDLEVTGEYGVTKYGRQFKAETITQIMPADLAGIERYLASGLVDGIGPTLAKAIVEMFGEETLDVLDNAPERLKEVHGIGEVKSALIAASWQEQQHVQEIVGMLSCIEISLNTAQKILKKYGAAGAVEIVRTNPYQLAYDIEGIGFKKADALARKMGLAYDDPNRLQAAVLFALTEAAEKEGHVYLPKGGLIERVLELTGLEAEMETGQKHLVESAIVALQKEDHQGKRAVQVTADRVDEVEVIYLRWLWRAEKGVVDHLVRLLTESTWTVNLPAYDTEADTELGELNDDQREAISTALSEPVSILTGGPGTGKSFTMKALIGALEESETTYVLCAPTGRAAKRLAESTGRGAKTIHRTIGYVPGEADEDDGFDEYPDDREKREIDTAEFVIVDEASMVDISLANRLLKAIPNGAHLLLVGDVDQLPPVGAGNFLRDAIDSGVIPVTRLTQIYRQAAGSNIIVNAHAVNQGRTPTAVNGDYFVLKAENGEEAAAQVVDLVVKRLPAYGLKPSEVQVLSPMHRGPAGVKALNEALQAALNPANLFKPEMWLGGRLFRVGDRVMQIKNDYDRGVFNGDVGQIVDINLAGKELIVDVEGKGIVYPFQEVDNLVLAYASTVHKAQGSEYPCVVMIMLTEQYVMLQRNLLYTGITRAKRLFVMLSTEKAVQLAVRNNKVAKRYTGLAVKLAGEIEMEPA